MANSLLLLDAALGALAVYLVRCILDKPKGLLPPGPKGLPILGNAADMPKSKEWLAFAKWGREYGGICSVSVMGRRIVIVNSADVMEELDKKGSIYSDRPILEMGGELVGYSNTLVLLRYGPRFRNFRKHFARYIGGTTQMQLLHPLIESETRVFLRRVMTDHTELMGHLRKLAGGIILGLTYGYEVQEGEDPFVSLIERANENFNVASIPGNFLVDFFPILRHLPEWLPGMGFMKTARKWAKDTAAMVDVPFAYTEKQIAANKAVPSFVSTALENRSSLSPYDIQELKFTASSLYGGGADTTVSAEYAFFLAMVLRPDVQKKAQAEIDAIVGDGRLPTLADRPNLPYVNAVVSEVLRWNSVAPTGVPHVATEDGFVNGYFVPKGTLIIANIWNMLHDAEIYPDPFNFDPERHIAQPGKPAQREPRTLCFGYGRRICPGMYLADASLFSVVAASLAVFDITNTIENGVPIIPVHENTSGTISYPEHFKCTIKPRSAKAISLITENQH